MNNCPMPIHCPPPGIAGGKLQMSSGGGRCVPLAAAGSNPGNHQRASAGMSSDSDESIGRPPPRASIRMSLQIRRSSRKRSSVGAGHRQSRGWAVMVSEIRQQKQLSQRKQLLDLDAIIYKWQALMAILSSASIFLAGTYVCEHWNQLLILPAHRSPRSGSQ